MTWPEHLAASFKLAPPLRPLSSASRELVAGATARPGLGLLTGLRLRRPEREWPHCRGFRKGFSEPEALREFGENLALQWRFVKLVLHEMRVEL